MEEWRPVVGHEDRYLVSSLGRVKSLPSKYHPRTKVLSPYPVGKGYLMVQLGLGETGKTSRRTVHSLVAEAFIGPRPEGMVVCHRDGVPDRNVVSNLRYDTQSNNMLDRIKHGTYSSEGHGNAKLSARKVKVIRAKLARGEKVSMLAKQNGVTPETVYLIRDRKIWRYV